MSTVAYLGFFHGEGFLRLFKGTATRIKDEGLDWVSSLAVVPIPRLHDYSDPSLYSTVKCREDTRRDGLTDRDVTRTVEDRDYDRVSPP